MSGSFGRKKAPAHDDLVRLGAYLDGELPPSEVAELERALAEDPALAERYRELRRLSVAMSVEDADVRAAAGIRAGIRARLTERRTSPWRPRPGRWWLPATAAAALVAVIMIASPGPRNAGSAVHAGAVVEQYALALDALAGTP